MTDRLCPDGNKKNPQKQIGNCSCNSVGFVMLLPSCSCFCICQVFTIYRYFYCSALKCRVSVLCDAIKMPQINPKNVTRSHKEITKISLKYHTNHQDDASTDVTKMSQNVTQNVMNMSQKCHEYVKYVTNML